MDRAKASAHIVYCNNGQRGDRTKVKWQGMVTRGLIVEYVPCKVGGACGARRVRGEDVVSRDANQHSRGREFGDGL